MKCSLGISSFLEEISSLSYSIVFLYFFALITEEHFLSLLFFGTLHSNGYIFPFLLCFSFSFLSSVQFSHSVMSDCLQPHESQHTRPLCPSPTPGVHPDSCPSSQWCHPASDAIQPSHPLLSPSPPAPNPSQHQSLFQWVNSSHEVAKVLEFQL